MRATWNWEDNDRLLELVRQRNLLWAHLLAFGLASWRIRLLANPGTPQEDLRWLYVLDEDVRLRGYRCPAMSIPARDLWPLVRALAEARVQIAALRERRRRARRARRGEA